MKKLEYIIILIIVFISSLFLIELTNDSLWNYGFAHSIYKGLIPYVDFNMVITPFYPLLCAFVFKIFGSSFLVFELLNSFLITLIIYFIKKSNKNYFIPLIMLAFILDFNYSVFVLLLVIMITTFEKKENNDLLIGILVGITIMTKQNVGIAILLPCFLFCTKKQVLKRVLGIFISCFPFFIYLLVNGAIYFFIDYTFLGLFDFASKNITIIEFDIYRILVLIWLIFISFKAFKDLIKVKFKNKELLYYICFLILAIPIVDVFHILVATIPLIVYYTKDKLLLLQKYQIITIFINIITF